METLMFVRHAAFGLLVAGLVAGCGSSSSRDTDTSSSVATSAGARAPQSAPASRPRIAFLGDSLTAGLGVAQSEAYPAIIGEKLRAEGFDAEVVNAGISGDTAAGGRRRLDWALEGDVRVLVLALGANDGLRGNPVPAMKADLQAIIREAKARGITVLLLGMDAPPNFGREYTSAFRKAFRDLADDEDVAFVPFFLLGVAGEPGFNQGDGLHPNAAGARRIADTVWTALAPLVQARLAGQAR
jgi:acyl-CoA thioesterase I